MALILQPTLEEMTGDVLTAIGEGGTGIASPQSYAMAQTLLRRAQQIIKEEAPWTIAYRSLVVSLLAGETTFEFPDGSEAGDIHLIRAQRTVSPQFMWDLLPGITTDDRSLWINAAAQTAYSYAPARYKYIDGMIEVGPACTQDITLTVQYSLGASVLQSPGDRPNCDGFAMTLLAEIFFRNHRGGDFRNAIPEVRANYLKHLSNIKMKQAEKESVIPGSTWEVMDPARRQWWNSRDQRHWMWRDVRP